MAVTLKESEYNEILMLPLSEEHQQKDVKVLTSVSPFRIKNVTFVLWWNLHLRLKMYRRRLICSFTLEVKEQKTNSSNMETKSEN